MYSKLSTNSSAPPIVKSIFGELFITSQLTVYNSYVASKSAFKIFIIVEKAVFGSPIESVDVS